MARALHESVIILRMTNNDLIEQAASVINHYMAGVSADRLCGDVGAALISETGNVHTGVCIDTPGWGLCAERSAIAAMVTAKEYNIAKIVAVWKDQKDGKLYVLPPCGTCRQFMRDINEANLETKVLLGRTREVQLKELLPYHEWPEPLEVDFDDRAERAS